MMAVKLHRRQLLLLPLVLLSVASLPTGLSHDIMFLSPCNIPVLREARRSAYTGEPDGWRIMDPEHRLAIEIVKSAEKQANVTTAQVSEAFYKKRCRQNTCRRFVATSFFLIAAGALCTVGHSVWFSVWPL